MMAAPGPRRLPRRLRRPRHDLRTTQQAPHARFRFRPETRSRVVKTGAANVPERERFSAEPTRAGVTHDGCPGAPTFAAPASPAAAWPSHDPPGATRSLLLSDPRQGLGSV